MSFLAGNSSKTPAASQKPMGQELSRASTAEQARPVPYLAGKQRVGLTFITDAFDEKAAAVVSSFGKKKNVSGYNYFASFAGLACHGPVDALHDIYLNGEPVYASATKIAAAAFTQSGTAVTFATSSAHGLVTGDVVTIAGVDQPEYNGQFSITVTNSTHFTYELAALPDLPPTAVNGYITARVRLDPVLRDVAHPDYADILIPDFGTMRLYWGTETQDQDVYLNSSGVLHPAYRGLCYAVFTQLFIGFNQTSVQNVELVLGRYPVADWHALGSIWDDANMVAVVADLLQNPRAGLALDVSRLDTATLAAVGADLEAEGIGISPLLTRASESKSLLMSLLEYHDAFTTQTSAALLGLGLSRPDAGILPEITDADMTTKPSFAPEDWASAKNETEVKFTNRETQFKEDMVRYRDLAGRSILGEPSAQTIDRPFITRVEAARALAQSIGRSAALPAITGRVKLRKGVLFDALLPGALFTFDYSLRNTSGLIFRVIERTWSDPAKPEFEIRFQVDRSYLFQGAEPEP